MRGEGASLHLSPRFSRASCWDGAGSLGAVKIITLDRSKFDAAATLLVDGFAEHWPDAWPTLEAARSEVEQALASDRVALAAVDGGGELLGWIGGIPTDYGATTWELHPLVVAAPAQGRGVGRALVTQLEDRLAARGVVTLMLGSDDEDQMTSVGGCDLYPDVLMRLQRIEDRRGHPFGFYRRLGYEVIGVIPDANGFGKPDILMARRLMKAGNP